LVAPRASLPPPPCPSGTRRPPSFTRGETGARAARTTAEIEEAPLHAGGSGPAAPSPFTSGNLFLACRVDEVDGQLGRTSDFSSPLLLQLLFVVCDVSSAEEKMLSVKKNERLRLRLISSLCGFFFPPFFPALHLHFRFRRLHFHRRLSTAGRLRLRLRRRLGDRLHQWDKRRSGFFRPWDSKETIFTQMKEAKEEPSLTQSASI